MEQINFDMEIEKWEYSNVNLDGTVAGGGSVVIDFVVRDSINDCCTIKGCKCRKCCWISINFGRQSNGHVYGITYYFKTKHELLNFALLN